MYRLLDALVGLAVRVLGFPEADKQPDWWCDLVIASVERSYQRRAATSAQNPILVQHWVDADTPHAEILSWFDHQIAVAPLRPHLYVLNEQRVFLIDAPAAEHQNHLDSFSFAADHATVVATWQDKQSEWYSGGRDTIRAAIPVHHLGLALVVNAAPPVVVFRHKGHTFIVQ